MCSIIVQNVGEVGPRDETVLALDIEHLSEAWWLVRNLAESYEDHGIAEEAASYWFRDTSGVQYIWAEADQHYAAPNSRVHDGLYDRVVKLFHPDPGVYARQAA